MALQAKQPPPPTNTPMPGQQRPWKVPVSKWWWIWLIITIVVYIAIFALYRSASGIPNVGAADEPLLLIGVFAFILFLATVAFSLRRRFARGLPGKAQDWLWMHTWVAIITLLVSFLHENYDHVTQGIVPLNLLACAPDSRFGVVALYSMILLVMSGIVGRLLDVWEARIIARDASTNGVGIVQSLKKRILELEYVVERLSAGKSEMFKQYCMQAIDSVSAMLIAPPPIAPAEQHDFQQAYQTLGDRSRLVQSLLRQEKARSIMRIWRYIHIGLGCFVLIVVLYHVSAELLSHVLHVLPEQTNLCP